MVSFAEIYILSESFLCIGALCYWWYHYGTTLKLPISILIFIIVKYFIDLIVRLKIPNKSLY